MSDAQDIGKSAMMALAEAIRDKAVEIATYEDHERVVDEIACLDLNAMVAAYMPKAESIAELSDEEHQFLLCVYRNPGCKLNGGEAYDQEGNPLWKRLEELKLIECVGSYKWKCLKEPSFR